MAEWWESAPLVEPASSPARRGYIPGTPKPRDPLDDAIKRQQLVNSQLEEEAKRTKLAEEAKDPKTTESENTAAFLATRLRGGAENLRQLGDRGQPTVGTEALGVFGKLGNFATPEDRQRVRDAQIDILDAALTLGTGAAYNQEQLTGYAQSYFPQIGDKPATIADKRQRLKTLLEAAKLKAGKASPLIDEALLAAGVVDQPLSSEQQAAALGIAQETSDYLLTGGALPPGVSTRSPGQSAPIDPSGQGDIGFNTPETLQEAPRLAPEQEADFRAFLASKPTAQQIQGRYLSYGLGQEITPEDAENLARYYSSGGDKAPVANYRNVDAAVQAEARELAGQGAPAGGQDLVLQGVSLNLGDELAGGVNALANLDRPIEAYRAGRDASRIRVTGAREKLGGFGTALELGSGVLAPGVIALRGAQGVGQAATLAERFARGGREAAPLGALVGFGQGEGLGNSALTSLGGAGIGYVGGGLINAAAPTIERGIGALGSLIPRRTIDQDAANLARAATEENVRIGRPIVEPALRDRMAFLESSPGSGNIIREGLQETAEDLERGAAALSPGGIVQDTGVIGSRVQEAGERFITRSRDVKNRLYDRAANLAGDARVSGTEAVRAIDEQIAELSQNPTSNRALIDYLTDLRTDFVDDAGNLVPKTVGAVRDLRTGMRGEINRRNLLMTDAERRVGIVLDAARGDIQRDLGSSAPAAVEAYARADRFNRERTNEINQVVRRVIGNPEDRLSGEQVFQRLKTMAGQKGDSQRLRRLVDKLSPEERADYAATVASSMGRKSVDDEFSPVLFFNAADALSPSARVTIFGEEGARSIANLRNLADAYNATSKRLNNSRSGVVQNWQNFVGQSVGGGTLGTLLGWASGDATTGGATGFALGATSAGTGLLVRRLSARALMNQDLSRWIAQAPRMTSEAQIDRHINRLATLATREPVIAQDIVGIQRAIQEAFESTPTRAAAETQQDSGEGQQ